MLKISAFSYVSLLTLLTAPTNALAAPSVSSAAVAESPVSTLIAPPDSTASVKGFRGVQSAKVTVTKKEVPLISGYGIYTDLAGLAMAQFAKWGQYEAGAHFGINGTYYPAVEVGIGQSNHTDARSSIHYNVHSPYFRVGLDYNLNKNRASRNRYYIGLRYGFSAFRYDLDGPDFHDNYWNQDVPFHLESAKGAAHWGEILFGLQTQIWKFIHLGWTVRYKLRIHEKQGDAGHAYYIPGYGKGGDSSGTFGGTFNIIFEL